MTVSEHVIEASICTDCYMYSHYGDESLAEYDTPVDSKGRPLTQSASEMAHDIRQGFDKLGAVRIADRHVESCDHDWDWQCVCYEAYFSWAPCGICDSHLGGDRHDVDIRSN
jgi:hypothetical protein